MKRQAKSSAFTLVELMIAMGILAIGLSMIATAFPTGVRNVNDAWDDTLATLIAENGLAITRAKMSNLAISNAFTSTTDVTIPDFTGLPGIAPEPATGQGDLTYPVNTAATSRYTWRVCMRPLLPFGPGWYSLNLYQVLIAVYRKNTPASPGDTVARSPNLNPYDGSVVNVSATLAKPAQCTLMGYYVVRTAIAP